MDPNWNGQQRQQQYFNPSQLYAQPLQQQPAGTPQDGYAPAAQQTPSEHSSHQQGMSQPAYQSLMQQMPTQQLQQQPSHQYHNQGVGSNISTTSATVGPWAQNQPSSQWQTATNNATTTTTTTTTTTKSSKETQASQSQPQYATSSTTLDFASIMQQAPPQPQTVQQQQQTINNSQTMQSGNQQQQTLPPPAQDFSQFMQNTQVQTQNTVDFSQLLQNTPVQTQNTVDFSQLIQTAPPPPPPPQPQVSQAPPVVQTPVAPQKAKSSKQSSNSTNKTTTTTTTNVVGSNSRRKAAEKGKTELRRFDHEVSERLKQAYDGICPMGFDYYATRQGYICGGGHHFFSHEDVEAMLKYGREPFLENVNNNLYVRLVTPPPGNGDGSGLEPLFWNAKQQSEAGQGGYAMLKDPTSQWMHPHDPYKQHEFVSRLLDWRATRQRAGTF